MTAALGSALNAVTGVVRIAQVTTDLRDVVKDSELGTVERMHRMGTDILMIGAQGLSAVAPYRNWSSDTRLALNGVLGVADTAQRISLMSCRDVLRLDDYLDFGDTVLFRVSNFLEKAIELQPVRLGAHLPRVKYVADALFFLSAGIRFTAHAALPFIRYMRERPHPIEMTLVLHGNRDPELRMDARWVQNWNQILEAPDIQAFQLIPALLSADPVLSQFKCPRSNNYPIRYVRVVRGTEDTAQPVYYERDAILRWVEQHPQEKPEGWPDQISFQNENIIESLPIQAQIDRRLTQLLDDLRPNRLAPDNPIISLARALQLHERERDDAAIVDELFERAARGGVEKGISRIGIATLMHSFGAGEEARLSRKITVTSLVFKRTAGFTERQSIQAFHALLGSQSDADRRILGQVLAAHRNLEIFISLDLQHIQFKWI